MNVNYENEYEKIEHLIPSIDQYVDEGRGMGDFLTGCFENDLQKAFNHADLQNQKLIGTVAKYIFNNVPLRSHGSKDLVSQWMQDGGRKGLSMIPAVMIPVESVESVELKEVRKLKWRIKRKSSSYSVSGLDRIVEDDFDTEEDADIQLERYVEQDEDEKVEMYVQSYNHLVGVVEA